MTKLRKQMELIDRLSNEWTVNLPDAEKEMWQVELIDGTTFLLYCNIKMAVEIEENGITIKAN